MYTNPGLIIKQNKKYSKISFFYCILCLTKMDLIEFYTTIFYFQIDFQAYKTKIK